MMNNSKTKSIFCRTVQQLAKLKFSCVKVGGCDVFVNCVVPARDLGIHITSTLHFGHHI